MAKPYMGARVMYCGHDGWFIADIFKVGNVNVIKANKGFEINGETVTRGRVEEATHHVSDFPVAGCWAPERGFLVVPEEQVTELGLPKRRKAK